MRKVMRYALVLLVAACLAGARLAADGSARPEKPEDVKDVIVHSTLRPSGWDVYLLEPGAAPRRLTDNPGLDYNAAFSPDGRRVVYTSERDGNTDLYALDLKSPGAPRRVSRDDALDDAAAFSPAGRRLAFVSTRSGNADIFVMPLGDDGTAREDEAVNITRHPAGDHNPAFSPDGEWIAFSSGRDATVSAYESLDYLENHHAGDIYVMHPDGSDLRRLTRHPHWDGSPAWSPDSRTLYFYSNQDGRLRLYRIGVDGAGLAPLGVEADALLSPAVSSTGRLAFAARRQGAWRIESAAPDGSDRRVETEAPGNWWAPAFDPQSARLVCHGGPPGGAGESFESDTPGPFLADSRRVALPDGPVEAIAIRGYLPAFNAATGTVVTSENFGRLVACRLDGSGAREVFRRAPEVRYRGDLSAWAPTWSADGEWIACSVGAPFGGDKADVDIWKLRPDGKDAVNLTPATKANDAFPQFSPDGRRIVFRSNRDGNFEVYLMDADGKGVRRLTYNDATDTMPAFSQSGDRVAFASNRDGDFEVYIVALDAGGQAKGPPLRVTRSPGPDMHPAFSPDDRWLILASARGGLNDETPLVATPPLFNPQPYGEVYAVRLEDGKTVRLTDNRWEDGPAVWGRPSAPRSK